MGEGLGERSGSANGTKFIFFFCTNQYKKNLSRFYIVNIIQNVITNQFYLSASKHGASPPATPTSHFVQSNKMLDKNALPLKMKFNQSTRFQNSLIVCKDLIYSLLVTIH
jgi:hypothetical protein